MRQFQNIGQDKAVAIGEHWGVCYDYALEQYGLDEPECGCFKAFVLITKNFDQVSVQNVQPGDLIVYHDFDYGEPSRMWAEYREKWNELENVRVKSQWGWDRTYKHFVGAVPGIYGTHVSFWRAKAEKELPKRPRIIEEDYA